MEMAELLKMNSLFQKLENKNDPGHDGAVQFVNAMKNIERPVLKRRTHGVSCVYTMHGYHNGDVIICWYECRNAKTGDSLGTNTYYEFIEAVKIEDHIKERRKILSRVMAGEDAISNNPLTFTTPIGNA